MGKSADKKLRDIARGKSRSQIDRIFDPADLDPDVAAYLRAKKAKAIRQSRRGKSRLSFDVPSGARADRADA